MEMKLTRRRFGQLAIASTATAAIGYVASKTTAQPSPLVIYGLRPDRQAGGAVLQALDVASQKITDITNITLLRGERFGGFTSLRDGTLVIGLAPVRASRRENTSSRLVTLVLGESPKSLQLLGLTRRQSLEDVLVLQDGSLVALVIRKNKRAPRLVGFNLTTGDIATSDRIRLPDTARYDNLTQLTTGVVYTTTVDELGNTTLVQLNLGRRRILAEAKLSFNGTPWNSGLRSLASSPADQLFALGARRYDTTQDLYTINANTGEMTLIRAWDVAEITIT